MPEAIASVIGGGMQASAAKGAAKTAANAQLEAAKMQQEAARETLGLSRDQFEYGQEQDLYQKALQRQMAQQQAEVMNENIQPFINLGLGSIGGLSRMVNPTMGIDSGLYELAGMQPRQATNIGPTFDPSAGHGGITPINFDEMDSFIQEQLEARRQAQEAAQQAPPQATSPATRSMPLVAPHIPEGVPRELVESNPGLALRLFRARQAANERQRIFARNQRESATGGRGFR